MELCDETLFDKLIKRKQSFPETEIKYILKQLNRAFKILYQKSIIHRDIKLQNILVVNKNVQGTEYVVKLADYGLSKLMTKDTTYTQVGTKFYAAPEIESNIDYDHKVDLWSLGVVIYHLLFLPRKLKEKEQIEIKNFFFEKITIPEGYKISDSLLDLLQKLLQKDPKNRLSWEEYFQHPFFNDVKIIVLQEHEGHIFSILELDDGNLAFAGSDNKIKICNVKNNFKCSDTLEGHKESVRSLLEFKNKDNKYLISASWDRTIRIWLYSNDDKNYIYYNSLEGHKSGVVSLVNLKDELIASGSFDGTIIIWDGKENFSRFLILENHNDIVYSLIELKNGNLLTASRDTFIKLWNIDQNYALAQDLEGHSDAVRSVIELKKDKIVSCGDDMTIRFWRLKDYNYICEKIIKNDSSVYSIVEMPNELLASASNNKIKLWNPDNYECCLTISEHKDMIFTMTKLRMGMLATGGRDGKVIICDPLYYFKNEEKKEELEEVKKEKIEEEKKTCFIY